MTGRCFPGQTRLRAPDPKANDQCTGCDYPEDTGQQAIRHPFSSGNYSDQITRPPSSPRGLHTACTESPHSAADRISGPPSRPGHLAADRGTTSRRGRLSRHQLRGRRTETSATRKLPLDTWPSATTHSRHGPTRTSGGTTATPAVAIV